MKLETLEFLLPYSSWIIGAVIFILFYLYFKADTRIKKYLDKFDGPLDLPIIGSAYLFLRPNDQLPELLLSLHRKYKGVYRIWIGNTPYVCLSSAVEVEKILSSTIHIEKSTDYGLLHGWLGLGLLTAKPQPWHKRRKQLTPTSHFKILEEFVEVFNEQGNILMDILHKEKAKGDAFDIFGYVTRCALDIICETAMGKNVHAQQSEPMEYVKAVYGYGEMIIQKGLFPFLQIKLIAKLSGFEKLEKNYLKTLHEFTETVIAGRKRERELAKLIQKNDTVFIDEMVPKRRKAFLDLLLDLSEEADHTLTDLEIREEVDTFMFEGHDTTAANIGWTTLLLSSYPEHQKKVQEELDEIFGDDRTREITYADIARMKYLELCIKESLRIYPSVPFNLRYLNQDADLGNNLMIPKGTNVLVSAACLHRDPNVFPDPESFHPERFLPEKCIERSPYAYIPFSAGPRNCIGQKFALLEDKIILAKLFMNFHIESMEKPEDVSMLTHIILRPRNGVHVKLRPRQ